jgi:RNA-dependent RNA polymerase
MSSFCTVLDGAKTGKIILPERYKQDCNSKQYGTQFVPPWKMELDHNILQYPLSRGDLPPFVMDLFRETMETIKNEFLRRIADRFAALPAKIKDADLVAPWQGAEARAQEMLSSPEPHMRAVGQAQNDALEAIKTHVVRVSEFYTETMRKVTVGGGGAAAAGAAFTHLSIESRQDKLRAVSREFVGGPLAAAPGAGAGGGEKKTKTFVFGREEVARLRASYAYLYDWTHKGGTRFPWSVAMRELGAIKLRARNDFKPISQDFYENMSMRKL